MSTEFKRDELYVEVWQTPLTQLGKKYGLSDNGVRKICKAMNIPLPAAGHWARVAVGQHIPRKPLPKSTDLASYRSTVAPQHKRYECPEDAAWLAERAAFEKQPENQITVEPAPVRWHAVVKQCRDSLRGEAKELLASKAAAERWESLPDAQRRGRMNTAGWTWGRVKDRGQRVGDGHKAGPVRASLETYERALAILNAIAWAADIRGFAIIDNEDRGRIILSGHDCKIQLRITEQLEKKDRARGRDHSIFEPATYLVPTGRLRITLDEGKILEDSPKEPLESMLNRMFITTYGMAVRCWRQIRESTAERFKCEEQKRKAREAEKARQEIARMAAAEQERRARLLAEAMQWEQAGKIRAYVKHVELVARENASSSMQDELQKWIDWALTVAQDLDHTAARVTGQL